MGSQHQKQDESKKRNISKPMTSSSASTMPTQSPSGIQPSSIISSEASDVSCCNRFWGPFRPVLGGHTIYEVATSSILPTILVLCYRALFTIYLITTVIYYLITGEYIIIYFTVWSLIGLAASFSLLTSISLIYLVTPKQHHQHLHNYNNHFSKLAFLSLLLFQVFATAALFLDIIFWSLLYKPDSDALDLSDITAHALNLLFVIIELSLSLNMNFKLMYILFSILYVVIYFIFMWVRFTITKDFPYEIFDYRGKPAGRVVIYYIGSFLWAITAGILTLLFSRLNRLPCLPKSNHIFNHQRLLSQNSNSHQNHVNSSNNVIGVVRGSSGTTNTTATIGIGDDEGRPFDNIV